MSAPGAGAALARALCGLALAALPATAGGGELLDLLRPGSRPSTGMTGDPFRSPFREGLSWAGDDLEAPRGVRAEAMSSQALDGRRMPVALHGSRLDWIVRGPAPVPGPRWGMAARVTRPAFDAGWSGTSGGLRLDGGRGALDLALQAPALVPGARVRGAFPAAGEADGLSRSPETLELAWSGTRRFALQGGVSWGRATDGLRSTVDGERFDASLNLRVRRYRGDLRTEILPRLAIEASVSDAALSPLHGRSPAPSYVLEPSGAVRAAGGGIEWRAARGPRLLVRRTEQRARLEADVSWSGERFGHLNYARADVRSWLGAAEWTLARSHGRVVVDLESARGEARARAEVESWPFTDALGDLLGARRIARGGGTLRWEVAHAGLERGIGPGARFRAGLAWYDLRPEGEVETWRPLFLVFGRTDVERHELAPRRVQLGELAIGGEVRLGALDLGLDVRQVVFAKVRRSPAVAAPTVPAADAAAPGPGNGSSSSSVGLSGHRLDLRVARRF